MQMGMDLVGLADSLFGQRFDTRPWGPRNFVLASYTVPGGTERGQGMFSEVLGVVKRIGEAWRGQCVGVIWYPPVTPIGGDRVFRPKTGVIWLWG